MRKRVLGLATSLTLAVGGAIVAPAAAYAAQPSFTTDVTEVPNERIDVAITGEGFDDVQALPGQDGPGAYFMLIEEGSDLSDVSDTDTAISAKIDEDGNIEDVLPVPAEELDESKSYEVISWPTRSFPTESSLYARADVTIDWGALFPEDGEEPEELVVEINGSEGGSVKQGDDVEFSVGPVDEGTEFQVTIESDPVELEDLSVADENGIATADWTVPEDFETGEHTVTFSDIGSDTAYEGTFTVIAADDDSGDGGDGDDQGNGNGNGGDGGGDNADTGDKGGLADTGAGSEMGLLIGGAVLLLTAAGLTLVASRRVKALS